MNKFFSVFVLSLMLTLAWSHFAIADNNSDREAIQTLVNQYMKAYNQRDEAAMEKLWAEDGDLVSTPGGIPVKGRLQVLGEIRQDQTVEYKDAQLDIGIDRIIFPGNDSAVVEAENNLTGIVTPGGIALPPITHYMLFFLEKDRKDWVIEGIRYYSIFPIVRQKK